MKKPKPMGLIVPVILFVIAVMIGDFLSREKNAAVTVEKDCEVVEINLYSNLETVLCTDGIKYTYKRK